MFINLKDALNYIENRRAKHSFDYFKAVLDQEHIDYDLKCIHVTGTNGKGGTIRFMASILEEAGYKVGTFTSPYIVCHQDRFTINGKIMDEDVLLQLINQNIPIIEKYHLAMFEIDFIMMLQYFKQQQVDIAIIEVGIGGRNDKTNMITPLASVITNIGHDHLSQIGPTLQDVAYEKAGIIKQQVPIFVNALPSDLLGIIQSEAKIRQAPLYIQKDEKEILVVSMPGYFHQINAKLAKLVVETIFPTIDSDIIFKGLKKAFWPGRFERFQLGEADIYLDGAHNLEAIQVLLHTVELMNFKQKPIFIYTALQDKDFKEMAGMIAEKYPLHLCLFKDGRALNEHQIQEISANVIYNSIEQCLDTIQSQQNIYVVCGSLHFISQFRNKIIQN